MSYLDFKKNALDLSYQRNLQILNSLLIIIGGGMITYFAALLAEPKNAFMYTLLLAILGGILCFIYLKIDKNLQKISLMIKNLGESEKF